MRLAIFTTLAPCGRGESFVLNEIRALRNFGCDVTVMPVRTEYPYTGDEFVVRTCSPSKKLFDFTRAFKTLARRPLKTIKLCGEMFFCAGSIKNAFKNLYFFPKALCFADILHTDGQYDFIYAHWLATTSTVAYIAARINDIPFGITGHRFDIYADNAINKKAQKSRFIRLINTNELVETRLRIKNETHKEKCLSIHLGVDIPEEKTDLDRRFEGVPAFSVPASLIPVKGHKYLIQAAKLLKDQGIAVQFHLFGEGPLENEIKTLVSECGVEDGVILHKPVENRKLLEMYRRDEFFGTVLPSVDLNDGLHEGIPVCLMEAMAHTMPAISTDTGGISELLGGIDGLLIPDKSPDAIAQAVKRLVCDKEFYKTTAQKCYDRALKSFNNNKNTAKLYELIENSRR